MSVRQSLFIIHVCMTVTFFAIAALVHLAGIFAYAIVFPRLEGVRTYRLHAVAQGSNLTVSFVDASVDDFDPGNDSVSSFLLNLNKLNPTDHPLLSISSELVYICN